MSAMTSRNAFSEREFYLREFRGRTLLMVLPHAPGSALLPVLDALQADQVRVVLAAPDAAWLEALGARPHFDIAGSRLEGELWRALSAAPRAGVLLGAGAPGPQVRALASRLLVFKLVWLSPQGGLCNASGERLPFVHGEQLRALQAAAAEPATNAGPGASVGGMAGASMDTAAEPATTNAGPGASADVAAEPETNAVPGTSAGVESAASAVPSAGAAADERGALWREVAALLDAGVPAVNVCSEFGLDAELFSYAGSGTLFTGERYIQVRRLGIDDYEAAASLVALGVEEGFLAPRGAAETDRILAGGFGAFVEGRHLAGIGALLLYEDGAVGEVACLYTLTRFVGEGVGPHLVSFACERARELGCRSVFACTTHRSVAEFFSRQGFAEARADALPHEKWRGYDPERRVLLHCRMRRLAPEGTD